MIERRPGSCAGSGRIAAWYTLVSASSSATKASRLSSLGGIEQCTAASVCQPASGAGWLHVDAEVVLGRHSQHHYKQHDIDDAEDDRGPRHAPAPRPAIGPAHPDAAEDDRERSENDLEDEYPDDPADKPGDGHAVGSGLRPRRGLGAGVRHWCLAPLKLNWQQLSARHAPKRAYSLRFVSNSGILSLIPHIGHGRVCVQLLGSARADGRALRSPDGPGGAGSRSRRRARTRASPPFCRTPLVTSNSDPIGWTLDRISVRMNEKNGAGRTPHLAPPAGRDVGKRPARPGRGSLSRAGGGQAPLIGGSAVSTTATPAEGRPGMSRSDARPRCRVAPSAMALLESARYGLAAAEGEASAGGRYREAHLAALRAAAAVVAAKADPGASSRRRRPLSVWELLPKVEPALAEWAAFFAAG